MTSSLNMHCGHHARHRVHVKPTRGILKCIASCRCVTTIQLGATGTDKNDVVLTSGTQLQKINSLSITGLYSSIGRGLDRAVCATDMHVTSHASQPLTAPQTRYFMSLAIVPDVGVYPIEANYIYLLSLPYSTCRAMLSLPHLADSACGQECAAAVVQFTAAGTKHRNEPFSDSTHRDVPCPRLLVHNSHMHHLGVQQFHAPAEHALGDDMVRNAELSASVFCKRTEDPGGGRC